jgi:hypothetical protein
MTTTRTVIAAALALTLLSACSASVPGLPEGAHVTCASNDDCPSGTRCVTALGRCFSADATDRTAPSVAAGTASISPPVARAGTVVTVSFQATEELTTLPTIRFAGSGTVLGTARNDGGVYTVQFTATTDAGSGTHTIVATMVDLFANQADAAPVGELTLDFVPPTATAPVVTPAFARAGATLSAVVTLSEPSGGTPSLAIAPSFAFAASAGPGANQWTFTRTVTGAEPEGAVDLVLDAADAASNTLSQRFTAAAHLDFTKPQGTAADVTTPRVKAGDTFVGQVAFGEPLGGAPAVQLVPAVGSPVAVTASAIDDLTWALSYQVPPGAADGDYALRVTAFQDRAGNAGDPAFLGTVHLDSTPPAVLALAVEPPSGLYRAGQTVTATFSTSEDLAVSPVVRLETLPLARDLSCASTGPRAWSCTVTLDGTERPENIVSLSVRVVDAAGNVTSASTSVVLDFTAPRVLSAAPGKAAFPAGGTITYVVSSSEPLGAPPSLGVTVGGVPQPGFFGAPSASSATTFSWSRAVPASLDGTYAVTVAMTDQAGNPSAISDGTGFSVDTVLPSVVGTITVSPAKAAFRAGDQPSVTFTVNKAIPAPTARLNTTSPVNASCTGGPTTYSCQLVRPLTASDLPEGAVAMLITLTDTAGNVGYGSKALVLDYTPAALAGAAGVQLVPGPSNLRTSITALGTGSTCRISLIATEPLAGAPAVVAWDPGNASSISLSLVSQSGTSYVYQLSTGATAYPTNTWTVRWDPVDLAGNRWGSPPAVATLTVDSQPPAAPVTGTAAAPLLLWERTPWGTSTSAASSFVLHGYAGSSASADLAVAWDAQAGREVGRAAISGGTFDVALSSDPTDLWVSVLDAAGNESPRVRVVDVAWTAGLAGKIAGSTFENPHRLETRTASLGAVQQQDAVDVGAAALGISADGLAVQTGGASFYRPVAGAASPSVRRDYSLAYDAGRGRTVLYGGQTVGGGRPGDTWEWDGNGWELRSPADPEGDGNPETWEAVPALYDPINGGVLLVTTNTWLWDGTSWRRLGSGPPGTYASSAAWDDARGVAVYLSGSPSGPISTYEWNGSAWADATPVSTLDSPDPRYWHRLAYDPARAKVILFGGYNSTTTFNDLWEWNGVTRKWTKLTAGGAVPPPRGEFAMAWDAAAAGSGELVVQGGGLGIAGADSRTYVLRQSGSTLTWFDVTPATTTEAMSHSAVYDASAGKVLMFGAYWNVGATQDRRLRAWSGSGAATRAWTAIAPGDPEGDGNPVHTLTNDAAIAWVPGRGATVYLDDRTRDTWEWNHASWVHAATSLSVPAPPSARSSASLGYYGSNAILFGGNVTGNVSVGDTWSWNGTAWSLVDPSPVRTVGTSHYPAFRDSAGMVTNPSNGRLYRFGGEDFAGGAGVLYYSDVHEWNSPVANKWNKVGGGQAGSAGWSDPQGDGSPGDVMTSEVGAARGLVAWDPSRGDVGIGRMIFVPLSGTRVWEWIPPGSSTNPNSWVLHTMTTTGSWPSSLRGLFYDTTLNAPVLVSGPLTAGQAWILDLDANVFRQVPLANPLGLVEPDDWIGAFDGDVGRAVVVAATPYTWESGAATRPAHVLHVDFSRANAPDPGACVVRASCPIQQIDVRWRGGGTAPGGTGATLQGWTGSWTALSSVAGTAAAPADATWTWTSASAFPASSLFHGRSRELTVQLVPAFPSTELGTASVGTDSASVTVRYRRP